ncbi:MAG: carbohydrate-binding family 9-like protein, partial [Gemmatimonadales bacterium]
VIYHDNDFEVFIDPNGDTHAYYELEINALGTVWDLFLVKPYRDGGPPIDSWDIEALRAAVHLNGTLNDPSDRDIGWIVEMAIPWESLAEAAGTPVPPADGDLWRLNLSRVEWPLEVRDGVYAKAAGSTTGESVEDNWVWSPQGLVNMHYPEMWGFVLFSSEPATGASADPAPAPAEKAKWLLRRLYYRERGWYRRHGWYTDNLGALGLETATPPGHPWPPTISITPSGFEATLRASDGTLVRITADGRTR